MPAAAIGTLVFVGLLVVALAVTLIAVALVLRRVNDALGKVLFGVRAIAHRTQPLPDAMQQINGDLRAIADGLEALVPEPPPPPRRAPALSQPWRGGEQP